jgi:hypothetical protein
MSFNPLNPELNPICHLLALLGAHHILHVSRVRVNNKEKAFRCVVSLPACCLTNGYEGSVAAPVPLAPLTAAQSFGYCCIHISWTRVLLKLMSQLCTAASSSVKSNTGQTLGNKKVGVGEEFNLRVSLSVSLLTSCFRIIKRNLLRIRDPFMFSFCCFPLQCIPSPLSFVSHDSSVSIVTVVLDG